MYLKWEGGTVCGLGASCGIHTECIALACTREALPAARLMEARGLDSCQRVPLTRAERARPRLLGEPRHQRTERGTGTVTTPYPLHAAAIEAVRFWHCGRRDEAFTLGMWMRDFVGCLHPLNATQCFDGVPCRLCPEGLICNASLVSSVTSRTATLHVRHVQSVAG